MCRKYTDINEHPCYGFTADAPVIRDMVLLTKLKTL